MLSISNTVLALAPLAIILAPAGAEAATVTFTGAIPSGTDPVGGIYAAGDTGGGLIQFDEITGLQPDPTASSVVFNPGTSGLTKATSFTLAITGSAATILPLDRGFGDFFEAYTGGSTVPKVWNASVNAAGTAITYSATSLADTLFAGDGFNTTTTFAGVASLPSDFAYTVTWSDTPIGAPEPAAWAMLIVGFGAIGATMRRSSAARLRLA